MANDYDQLAEAIVTEDVTAVRRILESEIDLNVPYEEGETVLFRAVIQGNVEIVEMLLTRGADPNFRAEGPAASLYAPVPLELAVQARFLLDREKYNPIVELLQKFGAKDVDGVCGEL